MPAPSVYIHSHDFQYLNKQLQKTDNIEAFVEGGAQGSMYATKYRGRHCMFKAMTDTNSCRNEIHTLTRFKDSRMYWMWWPLHGC